METVMTRNEYDREMGWQINPARVEACERDRDLAHEADMRRLAREQLRGEDFSDEEIFPEWDDRDFF